MVRQCFLKFSKNKLHESTFSGSRSCYILTDGRTTILISVIILYQLFGTTYLSQLQGFKQSKNNYQSTLCNIPEEWRSLSHRVGRLKSRRLRNPFPHKARPPNCGSAYLIDDVEDPRPSGLLSPRQHRHELPVHKTFVWLVTLPRA
jgi:hypothetical protein